MLQKVAKKTASVAMDFAPKVVFFCLVPALGNWFVDERFRKKIEWDMRNECFMKWVGGATGIRAQEMPSRVMQIVDKLEAEMNKDQGECVTKIDV